SRTARAPRRALLTREESRGGTTFSVDNRRPDKCLVQTTVSDAALEMKSAAPRGPHVVPFSRGKNPAAGLLSLLTTGGLISVRRLVTVRKLSQKDTRGVTPRVPRSS